MVFLKEKNDDLGMNEDEVHTKTFVWFGTTSPQHRHLQDISLQPSLPLLYLPTTRCSLPSIPSHSVQTTGQLWLQKGPAPPHQIKHKKSIDLHQSTTKPLVSQLHSPPASPPKPSKHSQTSKPQPTESQHGANHLVKNP